MGGIDIDKSASSEQVEVQQLRAACDEDLLCRVYGTGGHLTDCTGSKDVHLTIL